MLRFVKQSRTERPDNRRPAGRMNLILIDFCAPQISLYIRFRSQIKKMGDTIPRKLGHFLEFQIESGSLLDSFAQTGLSHKFYRQQMNGYLAFIKKQFFHPAAKL
jgi:hypothetical protein